MLGTSNLLESIPETLVEEHVQNILMRPAMAIERIVSRGHRSPDGFWYDQDWDEWVLLIQGGAGLEFDGQRSIVVLNRGDHLLIPAGLRHRVAWTDPQQDTVWLAVHIHSGDKL